MKASTLVAILALAALPRTAAAQHEGHQMPGMSPAPASADCADSARQARDAAQASAKRLESARQNNDPVVMRSAVDDLQSALGFIQARLDACVTPPAAPASAASTPAPETPMMQPDATAPAPAAAAPAAPAPGGMAGMDHSKMQMPAAGGMAGMDHSNMGHSMAGMAEMEAGKVPTCKTPVDPKSAPRAEYKGKTYFFCSESDRQKFVANPGKYLKDNPK